MYLDFGALYGIGCSNRTAALYALLRYSCRSLFAGRFAGLCFGYGCGGFLFIRLGLCFGIGRFFLL